MFLSVGLVVCAASGQHEAHTEYGSPVRDALWQDVVNKNSAEPQAARRRVHDNIS